MNFPNSFNDKLDKILSEMPLRAYNIGPTDPIPAYDGANFRDRTIHSGPGGRVNTSKAYSQDKFYKTISDKLTRLTKHSIIILVGNNIAKYAGGPDPRAEQELLQVVNKERQEHITQQDLQESITLLIIGDNEQNQVTPWLILHQFGEGLALLGLDPWHNVSIKYKHLLEKAPPIDPTTSPDAETFGTGAHWQQVAFHHLFKMRSAREFLHGSFDNIDPGQEIVVEYLWHGGNIRMNYPEWIPHRAIDIIKQELQTYIDNSLENLKGHRITNQPNR